MTIREFTIKIDDRECPWLKDYKPVAFGESNGNQCIDEYGRVLRENGVLPRLIVEPIKREKKLVPFDGDDFLALIGRTIRSKSGAPRCVQINYVCGGWGAFVIIGGMPVGGKELLDKFQFDDGSPCGRYVEEVES